MLAGLTTGSVQAAGVAAVSPFANQTIKQLTTDRQTGETNLVTNTLAHAALGALEAKVTGNNAAAGAMAGAGGELAAHLAAKAYGVDGKTKTTQDLTEQEKATVKTLGQLGGMATGGLIGDNSQSAVSSMQIAERAVDNNYLFADEAREKAVLLAKVKRGTATEAERQRLARINALDAARDDKLISACADKVSSACQVLINHAESARSTYQQSVSYRLDRKDIYPKDYQHVEKILIGKDPESIQLEQIARGIAKQNGMSLEEARKVVGNIKAYQSVADLVGMVRGGTAIKYAVKPNAKVTTPPVNYEKVTFNGIELHPDLPPPKAGYDFVPQKAKGNSIYQQTKDINGYRGEIVLANNIAETGRTVIKWGNSTGTHGSDIISVNPRTGEVELWDSKYRSGSTTGKISPTFDKPNTRASAIEEAKREIESSTLLSSEIRQKALDNLDKQNFTTYTVGSGKVKSSVIQKYCDNQKCQ